jgi:hypothetical protein
MKKEANATKSAFAIMTPEEEAAPKKATDSEHQSTRTPS